MHTTQLLTLSTQELALFGRRVEDLLEQRGITIEHAAMREALAQAGALVENDRVRFPRSLIHKAVQAVPSTFTLCAPDPQWNLTFPHPHQGFYTRTNTGAMQYLPKEGEVRPVTLADVAEWTRLANALPHIHFLCLPSTSGEEVPIHSIDLCTLDVMLRLSRKHIWVQPYEAPNVRCMIDLAAASVGGYEKLRSASPISFISCSVPVLHYKEMDAEVLWQCAQYGIPVQCCSLPTAGANAPVTGQGVALLACAEVLAQIVMLELLAPGTPAIATPLLFSMDMMTTFTLQSNTQITLGRLIAMQYFEQELNIRAHSYGTGTDSVVLDSQNMLERSSLAHMMGLCPASILGGAGQLETAKTISPLQLIIDDGLFDTVQQLRQGLDITDETLDFQELLHGTGEEGFITSDHTLEHYQELHRPELYNRSGIQGGTSTLLQRAAHRMDELLLHPSQRDLPPQVVAAMDEALHKGLEVLEG
ncbi:MAG: trimethylamine methyltransferase family protein [Eubacteriales bacterium]|jgi:trimethylamine--corrinoid protein Co-methyltransferase